MDGEDPCRSGETCAARNARNARSAGAARPARAVAQDRCALARRGQLVGGRLHRRRPLLRGGVERRRRPAHRRAQALLARLIDVCFAVERADDGIVPVRARGAAVGVRGDRRPRGRDRRARPPGRGVARDPGRDPVARLPDPPRRRARCRGADRSTASAGSSSSRSTAAAASATSSARRTARCSTSATRSWRSSTRARSTSVPPPAAPVAARTNRTRQRAVDGAVEPEAPYGPGVESPHPGPNGTAVDDDRRSTPPKRAAT